MADIFTDCHDMFLSDKPLFFSLLEEYIDFSEFIPTSFYTAFYQSLGRKRDYPLNGFIASLIFQKVCSIPTDSLLIILLHLCKELREFCGFSKVPDASKFTRFKQDSAFDKFDHYTFVKTTCGFKRALIPLNTRNTSTLPEVGYNEYGYPLCPNNPELVMKRRGITGGNGRSPRVKWICPKTKMVKGNYVCSFLSFFI